MSTTEQLAALEVARQLIAKAVALLENIRVTGASIETSRAAIEVMLDELGLQHRWVGTRLDLMGPDGEYVVGVDLIGPRGLRGLQGDTGDKGDTGDRGPAWTLKGTWNSSDGFLESEAVTHTNKLWLALRDNVNVEPTDVHDDDWSVLLAPNVLDAEGVDISEIEIVSVDADQVLTNKDIDAAENDISNLAVSMFAAGVVSTDGTLSSNSDTKLATQKAVKTYADQLLAANDALVYKGDIDCSANPNYPAADCGWQYRVSVAGKIGGASGEKVEAGDLLTCKSDATPSGNQATVGSLWSITQTNIDGAVVGPASSTSGNAATFSGVSGKAIQDSGKALPTGAIVGTSDAQLLASKSVVATGSSAARTLEDRFAYAVNIKDFGAVGVGFGIDTAAIQAAFDYAETLYNAAVDFGGGIFLTDAPIVLRKAYKIIGAGEAACNVISTHNGPVFIWDVDTGNVEAAHVDGITFTHQSPAEDDYEDTRVFLIQGSNAYRFVYNRFSNLTLQGFYAGFEISKDTEVTSFGHESTAAWLSYKGITIRPGAHPAEIGWLFPQGSGTGSTYEGIKTSMGTSTARVFDFRGTGDDVVGDIVINGGHFGGTEGSKLLKIGAGTKYRNCILVNGSQLDGGITAPFDFDPGTPVYQRLMFAGNDVGGGVLLGNDLPANIANSIIDDQLVSSWRAGNALTTDATGDQVTPLFAVEIGTVYTGTVVDISISGLVGSVGGGVVVARYIVARHGGTGAYLNEVLAPVSSGLSEDFYSIVAEVVGNAVIFKTAYAPAGAGSYLDAQIRCSGGTFKVTRL